MYTSSVASDSHSRAWQLTTNADGPALGLPHRPRFLRCWHRIPRSLVGVRPTHPLRRAQRPVTPTETTFLPPLVKVRVRTSRSRGITALRSELQNSDVCFSYTSFRNCIIWALRRLCITLAFLTLHLRSVEHGVFITPPCAVGGSFGYSPRGLCTVASVLGDFTRLLLVILDLRQFCCYGGEETWVQVLLHMRDGLLTVHSLENVKVD